MSEVKLNTVQQIEEFPIYGNHYMDHILWSELDKIILDASKDMGLRSAASKKVYSIIGSVILPMSDKERVQKHVQELSE